MLALFGGTAAAPSSSGLGSKSLLAPEDLVAAPPSNAASVSLFVGDVAHTCDILPHSEGPSAVERQAELIRQRASTAARATSLRRAARRTPLVCASARSDVAVIIAADIRLPPAVLPKQWIDTVAYRHRGGTVDGCSRNRTEVVSAINHFTEGSDVFIHTDAAYVADIALFDHVVATRLSEEDGGNPSTSNTGNRGGLYVQWWRLSRAWSLLVEYEQKCELAHAGQEYKFVMKMRTDMNLFGGWKLLNLYHMEVLPRFSNRTAFMSSDRFFGGSRKIMKHMSHFETRWRDYEQAGVTGLCGSCSTVCGMSRRIKLTPGFSQISLAGQNTSCNRGCFTAEQYSGGVLNQPPELWKQVCSVYRGEIDDALSEPRTHMVNCGQTFTEGDQQACIIGGGSESAFAYHVLRGNFSVRGFSEIDERLWSRQHAELMVWRHMVHMFDDGFTVDDGPLQSLEQIGNARIFVNLERHVSAQVSTGASDLRQGMASSSHGAPPTTNPTPLARPPRARASLLTSVWHFVTGGLVNCRAPTPTGGDSEDVMFMVDVRRGRYNSRA